MEFYDPSVQKVDNEDRRVADVVVLEVGQGDRFRRLKNPRAREDGGSQDASKSRYCY